MDIKNIKPSDINTEDHFWDAFGNNEAEVVARCLVICLRESTNDFYKKFTYEDVKEKIAEEYHLNYLKDFIEKKVDYDSKVVKYLIKEEFVRSILKFIK